MKTLIGAIINAGGIDATYEDEILGAVRTLKKNTFPAGVVAAAAALIGACDELTPEQNDVRQIQIYTAKSDPIGTEHAGPGEVIDVTFAGSIVAVRVGDGAAVPAAIVSARDALKSAISAAL